MIQYIAVIGYMAILVGIGVAASRRTKDASDYYVGGKGMGFLSVAFSSRATGESAWLLLGLTGFGAAVGVQGFWVVGGELLGVGLAWLWLARPFKRLTDDYDSITVPDYLESRFRGSGHGLRLIAAGALIVFVPIYVSAQIHATGLAFHQFLNWNYFVGALTGFLVVILYITRGGFIAVVWSDMFQGTLMVLGLVALPLVALVQAGGIDSTMEALRTDYASHLSFTAGAGWTPLSIATILGLMAIGIGFLGSPQVFVRFISLRSEKEIGRGAAVALTWTLLADSGAVLVGIIGRTMITGDLGEGSQNVLPRLVETTMPSIIAGLYVAIVLSAIMSTIDSLLVVASSAASRDYIQKVRRPDISSEELIKMSRRLTLALALVALAIAMAVAFLNEEQGVFWFIIFGWSGIAATFCPTIILSLCWARMTERGARYGMISGFLSVPFFKWVAPAIGGADYWSALDVLAPSFVVSGIVIILVSLTDSRGAEISEAARKDLLRSRDKS